MIEPINNHLLSSSSASSLSSCFTSWEDDVIGDFILTPKQGCFRVESRKQHGKQAAGVNNCHLRLWEGSSAMVFLPTPRLFPPTPQRYVDFVFIPKERVSRKAALPFSIILATQSLVDGMQDTYLPYVVRSIKTLRCFRTSKTWPGEFKCCPV